MDENKVRVVDFLPVFGILMEHLNNSIESILVEMVATAKIRYNSLFEQLSISCWGGCSWICATAKAFERGAFLVILVAVSISTDFLIWYSHL